MNNMIKIAFFLLLLFFLSLYFGRYTTDYYENKKVLTEEAISQFEKALKDGKEINPSYYLPKEKNYQNQASSLTLKASHMIENVFRKGLKVIVRYLDNSFIFLEGIFSFCYNQVRTFDYPNASTKWLHLCSIEPSAFLLF